MDAKLGEVVEDCAAPALARSTRVPSLDGLRALSISFVVIGHFIFFGLPSGHPIQRALSFTYTWGATGVAIFFGISGFIITTLLVREYTEHGRVSLKAFYIRRALRILPPMWVFLLVSLAFARGIGRGEYLQAFFFVTDYLHPQLWLAHTWSLSVEEQFYLLWPWVVAIAAIRGSRRAAWALTLASPILRAIALHAWPSSSLDINFHLTADAIMVGCLIALELGVHERPVLTPLLGRTWCAILSVFVLALGIPSLPRVSRALGLELKPVGMSLRAFAVASIIAWTIDPRNQRRLACRVLNWAPIVHLGLISYSLYLWQQPFYTEQLAGTPLGRFPLNLIVPLLMAECSYRFVEQPVLRLRGRLFRQRHHPADSARRAP